jgi:ELWxxDGT repeat protein
MTTLIPATQNTKQLFVIDKNVDGWRDLVNNAGLGVSILILDPLQDGLTQIANAITAYSNLDAIHILSHGSIASLQLGSTTLNSDNLNQYTEQLTTIGNALSENGDLLLYGCNVAQGVAGQQFIEQLSVLTGADVAASTNLTGDANQGGDWILESQTGAIEANSVISLQAQAAYKGTLGGNLALFFANDGVNGLELWATDGTTSGTRLVKDIASGANSSSPYSLTSLDNGKALINATDGVNGNELWITDGTTQGTILVKDIYSGANGSYPFSFTSLGNGNALFSANDGVNGNELWITDGTAQGTNLVKDINAGSIGSLPDGFMSLGNGKAVFSARSLGNDAELWITDGTAQGTSLVKDILSGSNGSFPSNFTFLGNGKALFTANDGVTGNELWITDGTAQGTTLFKDIVLPGANSYYSSNFTSLGNGKTLFSANDGSGAKLWITDGTVQGTHVVIDISSASILMGYAPYNITSLGNSKALFTADDGINGRELWITDGTAQGTGLVKDIQAGANGSIPNSLTSLGNGKALFVANDGINGFQLWSTDGTTLGTNLVIGVGANNFSPYNNFFSLGNGKALLNATDAVNGVELWITDGTAQGTGLVKDIWSGTGGSFPSSFVLISTNNITPTLTNFTSAVASGNEDSEIPITFASLQAQGNEADVDGTVTAFVIKAVSSGALKIGTDAITSTAWSASNNSIDASHQAYWTPALNANGNLNAFTTVTKDNDGLESLTSVQATVNITTVNDTPTFTSFISVVASGNEDSEIPITFASLQTQGDEADVDGTVTAFVIKAVNSGTLRIGIDSITATAWSASNNSVNATHQAYWTSALNTNGTLNAFTAVAKDNSGLESITPVQATVNIVAVNDAPVLVTPTAIHYINTAFVDNFATVTGTLSASDADAGIALTYGIIGGIKIPPILPVMPPETIFQGSTSTNFTVIKSNDYGVLTVDAGTGAYTFVPNSTNIELLVADVTFSFTVTVSDYLLTDSKTLTVVITQNGVIPTLTSFTSVIASGNEDSEILVTFANLQSQGNEADVDGTVTAFVIKAVSSGSLKIGTDAVTATAWSASNNSVDTTHQAYWTPELNANGTLNAFTAVAKDNGGLESISAIQVTLNVIPNNDAPVIVHALNDQTAKQSIAFSYTIPVDSFTDVDIGDTLNYKVSLADGSALPAWLSFNTATWTFNGTPSSTNVGNLNIQLTATDSVGANVSDDFMLIVVANNHNPTGTVSAVLISGAEDTPYVVSVADLLAGFSDADGDSLTWANLNVGYGDLTTNFGYGWIFNNNGTLTITNHLPNFNGRLYLSYDVVDGHGGSVHAVQSVNLVAVNDAPSGANKIITLNENSSYTLVASDFGFNDIDGNTLLSVTINNLPSAGNLKLNGVAVVANAHISINDINNGLLTFSPVANANGIDYANMIFQVQDNGGTANGGVDLAVSANTLSFNVASNSKHLIGTAGDDVLIGSASNDTFNALAGNDTISGGSGIDTMIGGLGNDSYAVSDSSDVVVENLNEGTDTVYSRAASYTLAANVENLILTGTAAINGSGNALNNQMTGNSADNVLSGGSGIDTMIGGLGNDSYAVSDSSDVVVENLNEGTDTVYSRAASYRLAANVENLILTGVAAINGAGNTLNNQITGNSADNILNGGAGVDTMIGDLGNDSYGVNDTSDVIVENLNEGTDTVFSRATSYTLAANVENLVLMGTDAINGTGNALNNQITGNSANNFLTGGSGVDTMTGGRGDDSYTVDNANDTIIENSAEGWDIVYSRATSYTLSTSVEQLILTGTAALNGTGSADNNILIGNTGDNILDGQGGYDILIGGLGKDTYLLTETTPAIDTLTIATGDSLVNSYDVAQGFQLGTGNGNQAGVDRLDLDSTLISGNGMGDGVDVGIGANAISSHSISNGIISFDSSGDYNTPVAVSAATNLANVISYLQTNITGGNSVAFIVDTNNTYVFQDGGVTDTLVELVGVIASSVNNTGLIANSVWIV